MESPLVIEILDRFGKIKERIKVKDFPCRIGRDYSNDIIIDDPYISNKHIEILQDGNQQLFITDLASDNGMYTLHPLTRHDDLLVHEDQKIRIGHTDIRFRSEAFETKETIVDKGKPNLLILAINHILLLPLVLALLAFVLMINEYLQETEEVQINNLLGQVLPVIILVFIWASAWSIASKIVTHKFYFAFHSIWASLFLIVTLILEKVFSVIEFSVPIYNLSEYLSSISEVIFVAILLYGHFRFSTTYSKLKAKRISVTTSILFAGIIVLIAYLHKPEFSNSPHYSYVLNPPSLLFHKSKSIDNFFQDTSSLAKFERKDKSD